MAMLDVQGGVISYDTVGNGDPVVILRGLGRTVKHWLGYEQQLAQNFQVITIDHRGVGASTAPCRWGTSIYDLADDVAAVLDKLAIERAHIMGVSLGGMVTLAMGVRHAHRCKSLVTVNTSIAGQRVLRLSIPAATAIVTGLASRSELHDKLVDVLVGTDIDAGGRKDIARRYAEIEKNDGIFVNTVAKQLVAASRFMVAGKLRTMKVPTLVVYGTEDRFVPNLNSRRLMDYLPDAKIVSVRGGGHELTLDKGPELTAILCDWVRDLARRSA